jgi:hypothetical protein
MNGRIQNTLCGRLAEIVNEEPVMLWAFFNIEQPGVIHIQVYDDFDDEEFVHPTSLKEMVDYHIEGDACCGGHGYIFDNDKPYATNTRAIATEMIQQGIRLLNACSNDIPTDEQHENHRK